MIIIIGYLLILSAMFFVITSLVGLIRLPDYYSKVHACSILDSFAIPLIFLGLGMVSEDIVIFIKLIILSLIYLCVTPVSCYAISFARKIFYTEEHNCQNYLKNNDDRS